MRGKFCSYKIFAQCSFEWRDTCIKLDDPGASECERNFQTEWEYVGHNISVFCIKELLLQKLSLKFCKIVKGKKNKLCEDLVIKEPW